MPLALAENMAEPVESSVAASPSLVARLADTTASATTSFGRDYVLIGWVLIGHAFVPGDRLRVGLGRGSSITTSLRQSRLMFVLASSGC